MHQQTVHPGIQEMAATDAAPSLVRMVPYLHVANFE